MSLKDLATAADADDDLSVALRGEPEFEASLGSAFSARLSTAAADAIVAARSVAAVQKVVRYCKDHNLMVAVRTGGHSWHSSWCHGQGSVMLDVKGLVDISYDAKTRMVRAGPGAEGNRVGEAIPEDAFFPSGHCPGVCLGGFILGGGYGLGLTRYGMTSMLVDAIKVVDASGDVVEASLAGARAGDDEKQRALMDLLTGSYSGYPAVVTEYTIGPLPPRPKGVYAGMMIWDIKDVAKALKVALDVQFRADGDDAAAIETTMVLGYAPPPVAEATGVAHAAITNLIVWADTEEEGMRLWNKYTAGVGGTIVPIGDPQKVEAQEVCNIFAPFYPKGARYNAQCWTSDESLYARSDADLLRLLQPIADMHGSGCRLPPPSHTIVVPMGKSTLARAHGPGRRTCSGYTPSLLVGSYAIYQDAAQDDEMDGILTEAVRLLKADPAFFTELAEGNVPAMGVETAFTQSGYEQVKKQIALLDPTGVFAGFH